MRSFSALFFAAAAAASLIAFTPSVSVSVSAAGLPPYVTVNGNDYSSYHFPQRPKPAFSTGQDVVNAYNAALADPTSQNSYPHEVYRGPGQGVGLGENAIGHYCTAYNVDLSRFSGRSITDTTNGGVCPNGGSKSDVLFAARVHITLAHSAKVSIRAGCDMGYGGVLLIDGVIRDFQGGDMWWKYDFNAPGSNFLRTSSVPLAAGPHTLILLGAEEWSNAGSEMDFEFDDAGYIPIAPPTNPTNPPAPITPIVTPGVIGDPQFNGFMGQSYQVHGVSDSIYNIISTPTFQYNALFRYLESGSCRVGTPCFSHSGNYFGSVGMMIKDSNNVVTPIIIESGDVTKGLTVLMNNQTLSASAPVQIGSYKLTVASEFEVLLESNEFNLRIQNSDNFLNQEVSIGSDLLNSIVSYKRIVKSEGESSDAAVAAAASLPHGVLGQTWSAKTYDNRWKYIAGQLFDYVLADGLLGNEFKYNRF